MCSVSLNYQVIQIVSLTTIQLTDMNMTSKIWTVALLFVGVLLLGACVIVPAEKRGKKVSRTVKVKEFHDVVLNGMADVIFVQGDSFSVRVEGREKDIECLKVESEAQTLCISHEMNKANEQGEVIFMSDGAAMVENITVYVTAPDLKHVMVTGTGDFKCEGNLAVDLLELKVSGTGDVDFKRIQAKELTMEITGTGDVEIDHAVAEQVSAVVNGAGDLKLNGQDVGKTLLTVNGSGDAKVDFTHCGKAVVDVSGSGDVHLSGTLQELQKSVTGSADLEMSRLILEKQ